MMMMWEILLASQLCSSNECAQIIEHHQQPAVGQKKKSTVHTLHKEAIILNHLSFYCSHIIILSVAIN
jgi:hypothetical protein